MNKVKQSFTLVEILVVIVIIGILSSFIFFTINDSVEKASIAKSKMFSESIRNNLLLNLVSEWKLDGDVTDSWGSNDATNNGATFVTDESQCISGECLDFDGGGDYLDLNYNTITNKTILMWIRSDIALDSSVMLFGVQSPDANSRYYFGFDGSGHLGMGVGLYAWSNEANNYSVDKKWHNYVLVSDNTTHSIYVDGNYRGQKTSASMVATGDYYIGAYHYLNSSGYFLDGMVDEIQIYNAAISESQIKQNYLLGLNNLYAKGQISLEEYNNKISLNE